MFCVHLVIDEPQTGTSGVVRQGRWHGPAITSKITPCWVTLLQLARRAAVLGKPSSLLPQWYRPGEGGGKRGVNFSKNFLLAVARQCRINLWPAVPDLPWCRNAMPECDAWLPLFRHSGIFLQQPIPCLLNKKNCHGMPSQEQIPGLPYS